MSQPDRTIEPMTSDWDALRPHHERGALFLVDADLDPIAVAHAIARDSADEVRGLIESGRLRRPAPDEVARWNQAPMAHQFRFGIVQPYVVARRIEQARA